MNQTIAASRI